MTKLSISTLALLLFSLTVFAQPPADEPPPPPPVGNGQWKGNRDKYNYDNNDDAPNKYSQMAEFMEGGTPLIPLYNNMDSLVDVLQSAGILVSPLCQDLPGENSFRICMMFDPQAMMVNPTAFKNNAILITVMSVPGRKDKAYAISLVKITRKGKKPDKEFEDNFAKKVNDVVKLLGLYFYGSSVDELLAKQGTSYIDNYQCELITSDISGSESIQKIGTDLQAFSVGFKTKFTGNTFINAALDSTQNATLQAELDAYKKHVSYIDSLNYSCDYYEVAEEKDDSVYTMLAVKKHPAFQTYDAFIADYKSKFSFTKSMQWKEPYSNDYQTGFVGTTKGKLKLYTRVGTYYSENNISNIYFYTPVNLKQSPKKTNKQLVAFTKEVLAKYHIAYEDSMRYYIENDKYNYFGNDTLGVNFKLVKDPTDYWGNSYLSVDTLEKGSTDNPYFYINLYAKSELKDTAAYRIASDSIYAYYNKLGGQCDSTNKKYAKEHKFVWKTLPPLAVKEDYQTTVLVPAFLQPDTLVKNLKTIVNDTADNYPLYGNKYMWQLLGADLYADSVTAPKCNIALNCVVKENSEDARFISLDIETNTGTQTPDSMRQKYNAYKTGILKLLGITLPADMEETALKQKWAYHSTPSYAVHLKEGIEEDGVIYSAIRIYPLASAAIGYTPYSNDIKLTDTLYHTIPPNVLNNALATADTVWLETVPENFENASTLIESLKKNGFNKYWFEDEQNYIHIDDANRAANYLISTNFTGTEMLMVPKKGDAATAAILYFWGPAPANNSVQYSHFSHSCVSIADALNDRIPLNVSMGINNSTTAQGFSKGGLMCSFYHNFDFKNADVKIGMALFFGTKYYLTTTEE